MNGQEFRGKSLRVDFAEDRRDSDFPAAAHEEKKAVQSAEPKREEVGVADPVLYVPISSTASHTALNQSNSEAVSEESHASVSSTLEVSLAPEPQQGDSTLSAAPATISAETLAQLRSFTPEALQQLLLAAQRQTPKEGAQQ